MRLTTFAAAVLVAVSTAALAQVARTPIEPKSEPFANMAPAATPTANAATGNDAMANDTPPNTKTEPPAPKR